MTWQGADGMTFDSQGNLYTGNFGDGNFSKVTFTPDGESGVEQGRFDRAQLRGRHFLRSHAR